MNPLISSSDSLIRQVTIQALTNLSQIPQLTNEQRKVLLDIINNNEITMTNTELDNHLKEIKIRLEGPATREESLGANFMRGLKTAVGSRISSEEVKANLLNPEAAYRQHILLDPNQILPKEICPTSAFFKTLPIDTQKFISQLLWEHLLLAGQRLPPSTPLDDPKLASFEKASMSLNLHVSDARIPKDKKELLISLNHYVRNLHMPNSQRPFLVFAVESGQQERQYNVIKDLIEKTRGDPNQTLQHQWALDGFITPFSGLNLWEKTTLHMTDSDSYRMKLATRVEGRKPEEKTIDIDFSLTPFRTKPNVLLTSEQTRKLFEFLKRDSLYETNEEALKVALSHLDFLSPEQKNQLVETHAKLYYAVLNAQTELYNLKI